MWLFVETVQIVKSVEIVQGVGIDRRCLDELGTGPDDGYYFHVETILKLVMVVVAARLGSANRETWRVNQGIS